MKALFINGSPRKNKNTATWANDWQNKLRPQSKTNNQPTNFILMKEQVLAAMRAAGKPLSAGEVAKSLNADRKEVDNAFADLKKEGAIVSPVRCKWTVA